MRPPAADIADSLGLEPHPEGGFYLETYRATETLSTPRGPRPASTAILFLVTAASMSKLHRLTSDELWVYQGGLPLEIVTIAPDGSARTRVLGDPEEAAAERGPEQRPFAGQDVPPSAGQDVPPSAGQDVPPSAGPERPSTAERLAGVPDGSLGWLPQVLVPAGSWQAARLAGGPYLPAESAWTLVSCVVSPGFDFADFEFGEREALLAGFPHHAQLIRDFT